MDGDERARKQERRFWSFVRLYYPSTHSTRWGLGLCVRGFVPPFVSPAPHATQNRHKKDERKLRPHGNVQVK